MLDVPYELLAPAWHSVLFLCHTGWFGRSDITCHSMFCVIQSAGHSQKVCDVMTHYTSDDEVSIVILADFYYYKQFLPFRMKKHVPELW
jgi:hypothetical protein